MHTVQPALGSVAYVISNLFQSVHVDLDSSALFAHGLTFVHVQSYC